MATLEVPIRGMDCADCTRTVQRALAALPGVQSVEVLLAAEKAVLQVGAAPPDLGAIRAAVRDAGYDVPETPRRLEAAAPPAAQAERYSEIARRVWALIGLVFGAVLIIVVFGEWFGLLDRLTDRVPFALGVLIVLAGGWPVFVNVLRAARRRQVIAHTLMTVGVLAALAVGQWATAAVVVLFMRVGDYAENFTTQRSRRALRDLSALAPRRARVARGEAEVDVPIAEVRPGDIVVVRPGEQVPADGEVVEGQASVNQAALTGEPLPLEAGPGVRVHAASLVQLGSLRVRVERVGPDTTFGKVIRLVEEAEAHRADVQRVADVFSAWYLPVVGGVAALTFLLRRDPLATAAVLVVACSCSFALATPIAMLAAIGAGARRGLLIKGGKYLERLARADVLLVDKTGTLTLGRPRLADVVVTEAGLRLLAPETGPAEDALLRLAATAERYSEHPLAEAVRAAARERGLALGRPQGFEAVPGFGVRAVVEGRRVVVGRPAAAGANKLPESAARQADRLAAEGQSVMAVWVEGEAAGLFAVRDTLRPDVPPALRALRGLGLKRIELLTGDNTRAAAALAAELGVDYRAELLPEDKIAIVREYQRQGRVVVMIGDGVNDAPALAQADVGMALGGAGSPLALEAAHLVLMRDDWSLAPAAFGLARRTLGVVQANLAFTVLYNVLGLSLAALGFLPPIFAAAAQSLPDLGILANSSRLLRHKL
jgi:Cu+-exporting ATPase